ncbi:proteasome accessory factor PafA2 family protein [Patescibacteria group bacterium]|nr:proteasome accessory factor PafA2 family protein [Patescibacteria group bacterium]
MSIPTIMGTEHEYGIYLPESKRKGSDECAYQIVECARTRFRSSRRDTGYELTLEMIARDYGLSLWRVERLYKRFGDLNEVLRYVGGSGSMMANGARFYVDLGHPEYSTPECASAADLLVAERVGELIVDSARQLVEKSHQVRIDIHKDNSDRKGASFAAHENYLVSPELFFDLVPSREPLLHEKLSLRASAWTNFLATRHIWAGSGKAGSDLGDHGIGFQLSQRAEFIRCVRSHSTTRHRGIINTRDNSYADDRRFKRLHVIIGDANMCEVAIFLKVGVSALFLKMLEDGFLNHADTLLYDLIQDPPNVVRLVSYDLSFSNKFVCQSGRRITALEIQEEALRVLERYCETHYSPDQVESRVLKYFRDTLFNLKTDPKALYGWLDHITKKMEIERHLKKTGKTDRDASALYLDFLYHNIDQSRGLYWKLYEVGNIHRLAREEDIKKAVHEPPVNTRAWIRGKIIKKFSGVFGNWNKLNIPSGDGFIDTIIMNNPAVGGKKECEMLLKQCKTSLELVNRWKRMEQEHE